MARRSRRVDPELSAKRAAAGRRGAQARWAGRVARNGNDQRKHDHTGDGKPLGYRIANATTGGGTAVIDIFGDIVWWDVDAALFVAELRTLDVENIEVHISSGGGDVFDGLAMYRALLDHGARITVKVDSLAASIASVIAQAGDTVVMAPNAQMMIHDAWCFCDGNSAELRATADQLDMASDNIAGIYSGRSGEGTIRHWRALMTADGIGTWFTATDAVEAGLADEVTKDGARGEDPSARWKKSIVAKAIAAAGNGAGPRAFDIDELLAATKAPDPDPAGDADEDEADDPDETEIDPEDAASEDVEKPEDDDDGDGEGFEFDEAALEAALDSRPLLARSTLVRAAVEVFEPDGEIFAAGLDLAAQEGVELNLDGVRAVADETFDPDPLQLSAALDNQDRDDARLGVPQADHQMPPSPDLERTTTALMEALIS